MSFEEFLDAFGKRDLYNVMDLYGGSDHGDYDELKKYYDIYSQIGGYPSVVKMYLESKDIMACRGELHKVILITELSKIVYKQERSRITKKSINQTIAWLFRSNIVDFCGKANECNPVNVSMNSRFYFFIRFIAEAELETVGA